MKVKVKFLPEGKIEQAAMQLLGAYVTKFGTISPPVPVDEILECHLGYGFSIEDLTEHGPDTLGATWVKEQRVAVDESLDPTTHPDKEGRYRFTVAHELGHVDLHAHQFRDDQGRLFDESGRPTIICRSRGKKPPIEWQADTYASYLLMPAEMVYAYWRQLFGDRPYVAAEEIAVLSQRFGNAKLTLPVARDMADHFGVSGQAMQIRLESLKLIRIEQPDAELF